MVGVSSRGLAVGEIGLVDIYHLVICRWASRRANTWLFFCIWQIEKRKRKKRKEIDMKTKAPVSHLSIYLFICHIVPALPTYFLFPAVWGSAGGIRYV